MIECPDCRGRYPIDPSKSSRTVARIKCPRCSHVFSVDFSAIAPAAMPKSAEPPKPLPPRTKVLIVDDARFFRELIADMLKALPVDFLLAADGVEALEMIRRERPGLVVLDLNLPRLDGYELIRQVRAEPLLNRVRLLAMSGVFRREEDALRAERSGADDFLNKSFTPEQLQRRVAKLLGISA